MIKPATSHCFDEFSMAFDMNEIDLTHLSLASFLWDKGNQNSPRCDTAERGVPFGVILFA